MEARDFRPTDLARMSSCREAVVAALQEWKAGWGIDDDVHVQVRAAHEASPLPIGQWFRTAGADAWLGVEAALDFDAALASSLFRLSSGGVTEIAESVAVDARTDLFTLLGSALRCAGPFVRVTGEVPMQCMKRGSGAIALLVRIGDQQLQIIQEAPPKRRTVAATGSSPCVAPLDALRGCEVRMKVTVGDLQLRLQSLASIAVGDVLRLDRRLDEPACVTVDGGTTLCEGYLGSTGVRRALSLTRRRTGPDRENSVIAIA